MSYRGFVLLLCCCAVGAAQSQQKMEITLERGDVPGWKAVPSNLVFQQNDRLRFRIRTNFDGYLYVMNYGTSGKYETLFPRAETGTDNLLKAGADYTVPATKAAFRVGGPAGYDVVYWILSPTPLGGSAAGAHPILPPPPPKTPDPNMTPRCDDTLFRSRSLCLDTSAGPRNVTAEEKLPDNLGDIPLTTSRDLVILNQQEHAVVSAPTPLTGPVVYEFRVAHK
ncbi:MAG TPA: DUF4384 domain-containing protein [Bryobacteraceae bacterium]|nr:DUF4384 domain-containing protein [Bryobacteraceae bacterium]